MKTNHDLKYHFYPQNGWMNDPNGLCYFDGYYHAFFQHAPHYEQPWHEPMVWGHARTKDFLHWEELPIALEADQPYDVKGAWSGTALEIDGKLWAFYASVDENDRQLISCAWSEDGLHFTKCAQNPVIRTCPPEGSKDFRDPAVFCENSQYYLVIASADTKRKTGNLLLYRRGKTNADWIYSGVLYEYPDARVCECPSFVKYRDGYILSCSVIMRDGTHFFEVLYGQFDGTHFTPQIVSHFQKGPDEYAGQIFRAPDGRCILISWAPGWAYQYEKCIGCLSLPLELTVCDDKIKAYPVAEVRHLLDENDRLVDAYLEERFVRDGEEVYITLL